MKIKINWGTAIVIVIVLFIGTIALRIFLTFQYELNLVEKDYYPKEVEHQKHIEKVNNTASLQEKIVISEDSDNFTFKFPNSTKNQKIKGVIVFYRPSDTGKDLKFDINQNVNRVQIISKKDLIKGKYIIKIDWEMRDAGYYQEQEIMIK
jgi:hypothetical protein